MNQILKGWEMPALQILSESMVNSWLTWYRQCRWSPAVAVCRNIWITRRHRRLPIAVTHGVCREIQVRILTIKICCALKLDSIQIRCCYHRCCVGKSDSWSELYGVYCAGDCQSLCSFPFHQRSQVTFVDDTARHCHDIRFRDLCRANPAFWMCCWNYSVNKWISLT